MTRLQGHPTLERSLQPGWFIHWQRQTWRVVSYDKADPLHVVVEKVATGEAEALSLLQLLSVRESEPEPIFAATQEELQMELEHQAPAPQPVTSTDLPESLLAKADAIIAVVQMVDKVILEKEKLAWLRGEEFQRTPATEDACSHSEPPVALATYYKYRKLYRACHGDRAQMAATLRRSTFNQSRMDTSQRHFVDVMLLRFYTRENRPRPATVYNLAQGVLQRTGSRWIDSDKCVGDIPQNLVDELLNTRVPMQTILDNPEKAGLLKPIALPSPAWFYGYVRSFEARPDDGLTVVTSRYGKETWEHEHMVFDTFVTRAAFPLQYVFADHWLLDVFIVDEATRSQLNRLWLTALIDAFSRSILGLALLYESPCIHSIQSALQHAIWPKTSHTQLGIQGEWACYGIPQQLSLDNAWAHHSHSLENLARNISRGGQFNSIDLDFRPPYRGRYGALIERYFGNLSGQVKQLLPGAIQSSHPRDIRNAAREACLLYQDVYKIVHRLIVNYQHTPHHELGGMTPREKWAEGLQLGLPLVPPHTPEVERLFWRTSPETRPITHKGICAFGFHYWSPLLSSVQCIGVDGRPVKYAFHYDPADISRLAIFRDGHWIGDAWAKELRLADGTYQSISLWERAIAKDLARGEGRAAGDWLTYLDEIDDLRKQRVAEKKTAQRLSKESGPSRVALANLQAMDKALQDLSTAPTGSDPTQLLTSFVGKRSA